MYRLGLLLLIVVALTPRLEATDLRIGQIPLPASTITAGDSTAISFQVENTNQLSAEDFYMNVTIRRTSSGAVVFSEDVDGASVPAYSTRYFSTLRGWRPTLPGAYQLRIEIFFGDDIDTTNNIATKPIAVVLAPCTDPRPIGPPSGSLVPLGPVGTSISYSTNDPCCWKMRASPANEPSSEVTVSPSAWVELTATSPVRFDVTTTRTDRPYMVKVEWRRCDEEDIRIDYLVLAPNSEDAGEVTNGSAPNSGSTLDPVNTLTGELFMPPVDDIRLDGPMPLAFSRYYASGLARAGFGGALGPNWSHSFEWRLFRAADVALVMSDRGRPVFFERIGALWSLDGTSERRFLLAASDQKFLFVDAEAGLVRTFDSSGALVAVSDPRAGVHSLTYSPGGRLTMISDGLGRVLTLTHDSSARISTVSDGARTVRYFYDDGPLTRVVDADGGIHTYAYEAGPIAGLLASHTLPMGNAPYRQEYDAAGRVLRQTDAAGATHTFAYARLGTTITDPLGRVRTHVHGSNGELLEHRDETDRSIHYTYDALGRRTRVVDRDGDTTTYTYDALSGRVASIRDADGAVTSYEYVPTVAGMFALSLITFPDGLVERFEYDAVGRTTALVDRAGKRWSFSYGSRGELLTETTPIGATTRYTYDASGMLVSMTDPAGNATSWSYDGAYRVTRVTHADGASVDYTYDALDNVLSVRDPRGNLWRYEYDANNRLTATTTPMGRTVRYTYDASNRLAQQAEPDGGVWSWQFDSLGRARALIDAAGNRITYQYDARGELETIVDGEEKSWRRTHTGEGSIASTISPSGVTTRFERDRMGRITRTNVGDGALVGAVEYDVLGRTVRIADGIGNESSSVFAARGEPMSITLTPGITADYAYDDRGAVTGITDPNEKGWTRTYDAMGRLQSVKDPLDNTTTYHYDARNRVDSVGLPGNGSITLRYDAAGNLLARNHSDGLTLDYTYDADGRLVSANGITLAYDATGRITRSNGIAIERDVLGRIAAMSLAEGKRVTYTYDRRGLVTSVRDWRDRTTTFDYDDDGRLVKLTRPNGTEATYRYDAAGMLRGINEGALSSIELTRDASGRVTSAVRTLPLRPTAAAVDRTLAYDAASQLTSATHDARGRVVGDGARTFVWDMATRLISYVDGSAAASMIYDALGNRVKRMSAEATRDFVWNYGLGIPSISISRNGTIDMWYYIHTPDGRLLYAINADDEEERQYHFDERGSTIFLTDGAGVITDRYTYGAYGAIARRMGSTDNPFTFIGQHGVVQEGSTGLYLMRRRYYDATAGRFISRDPLAAIDPQSVHPYQYAFGNPFRYVDITGLSPEEATAEPEMTDAEFREKVERDMERWQRDLDRFARRDRERAEDQRGFDKAMRRYGEAADALEPKNPPLTSQPRPPAPPTPPTDGAAQTPPTTPPPSNPPGTTPPGTKPRTNPPGANPPGANPPGSNPPGGSPGTPPGPPPANPPRGEQVAPPFPPGGPTRAFRRIAPRSLVSFFEYFVIID